MEGILEPVHGSAMSRDKQRTGLVTVVVLVIVWVLQLSEGMNKEMPSWSTEDGIDTFGKRHCYTCGGWIPISESHVCWDGTLMWSAEPSKNKTRRRQINHRAAVMKQTKMFWVISLSGPTGPYVSLVGHHGHTWSVVTSLDEATRWSDLEGTGGCESYLTNFVKSRSPDATTFQVQVTYQVNKT